MQFVAPVKEEFKCKTCGEPWDPDAAVTCADCESVFCKACHDEALAKAGACPACRKSPATFKSPHRLLLSMASSLEVFCTNRCHGCPWTGPRSGYTSHVSACALHPKEFTYVDEGSIPDELRCPICHDAMMEPVALACDHVFCRKCMMASLSKNEQCPVDRSAATPGDVMSAPKFIATLLDDLPVYCQHRSSNPGPCAWSGRRRDYLGHRTVCTGGKEAAAPPPPATLRPASPPPATRKPVISPVSAAFGGMKVEAIPEFPVCHATDLSQDLYVLAHITAPKLQSVEQRQKPLAISAVIDVSGSMSGSKLQMAMETLEFMINELSERDFLGIVAFQSTITECSRMLKMDALGKESARLAVRRLRADGCTNLSGGLKAGLDQLNMRQFASIPIDAAKPVKVEKPTWAANGLSRLFGKSQRRDSPRAEPLTFEVTVWSSPMRRDGKDMFSYSADVKLVGGPRSAIKSVELKGVSNSLTPRVVDLSAGGTVRWDPVPAAVAAAEFTVTLLKERESVFAFPLAEGQTTRSFTIPPPPSVQPPHRADPAAAEWTDASGAVLLFTDGAANEGISNPAQLQAALKDWLSSSRSAVVHTFGFGADHNASLLQQLAEIGSGSYYYIQDVSTMKTSFADCLGGLLSTVAENIKLSVKANPSFTVERVLTTLKLEVDSSGSHVVTMRDMYSEETRDVLVKVKMTRPAAVGDSLAPVTFSLEFDSLISGARECVRADCALSAAAAKCSLPPNTLVDQQRSRILATEAIEAARKEADSGRVEEARRLMNEARNAIAFSASAETTYAKAMVRDCDALTDCMADRAGWAATGSKQAAQVQSCHAQQRWNAPTESKELSGYDNEFKKACRAKAKR